MDTSSLIQIPGYQYNEYLLVLYPHQELRNKIIYIKNAFADKYKTTAARFSTPQITLVNFIQFQISEERLFKKLAAIASSYHPFKVELKDFGSFPSHTIFITVDTQLQVKNLVTELKAAQQLMTLDKQHKAHFIDTPYIPLARKLAPWQYEKAWLEYSNHQFTGRFIADTMILMKRKLEEKTYRQVQEFRFMNLPVTTKQGDLFV